MAGLKPTHGEPSRALADSVKMKAPLLIRVDADADIGTGHLMRCLALAQAWQAAGGRVRLLMATEVPVLQARLQAEGMEVMRLAAPPGSLQDAGETAKIAGVHGSDWVVVDGYQFGADYQRLIKDSGFRLLCIDDYGHATHYCADLVLNQNIYAHKGFYSSREPGTCLLLGTRYALLRREFSAWRGWHREAPEIAGKILITLGGGDSDNVTLRVIKALRRPGLENLEAVVVIGGANPHRQELRRELRDFPHPVRLMSNVSDMPGLMAWADMAVTGAGSTCWELAFMGLPALTIVLADNQRPVAENLEARGVVVNLGWQRDLTEARLAQAMAELIISKEARVRQCGQGRKLVDGKGAVRVVKKLVSKKIKLPTKTMGGLS